LDGFRAIQSPVVMGPGVRRDDDVGQTTTFSRRDTPELCPNFPPKRGRGECRVLDAPAAPCATESTGVEATGTPVHPAFPHAMVLTVSFALSPVIGLYCHRHWRFLANLTPASRRQDHTTSPSASSALVRSAIRVHRIPLRVRDDRDTPLCGARRRKYVTDLGQAASEISEIPKNIIETKRCLRYAPNFSLGPTVAAAGELHCNQLYRLTKEQLARESQDSHIDQLGRAELRMEILITDVTEMSGTNYCVAGWDATNKCMVRPLPGGTHWPQTLIAKHEIKPERYLRRH
jgi:hypothetical protein